MVRTLRGAFEEFVHYHQWEKQSRPRTILWHRKSFEQFFDKLFESDPPVTSFHEHTIRKYLVSRLQDDKVTQRTLLNNWQALKAFSRFLIDREYVNTDPMKRIVRPRVDKRMPDSLDERQVRILMNYMIRRKRKQYRFMYLRDLCLIAVFVYAGLRRSEALKLKLADVDLEHNVLKLNETKSRRVEQVPICSSLREIIEEYLRVRLTLKRKSDAFFVGTNRTGYSRYKVGDGSFRERGLQWVLKDINDNVGQKIGKHIHPHLLRRSFATMLLARGENIVTISRLLRHRDISTTVGSYIGFSQEELSRAVERHPLNGRI